MFRAKKINSEDKLRGAYNHAIAGLKEVIVGLEAMGFSETIAEINKHIEECEALKGEKP